MNQQKLQKFIDCLHHQRAGSLSAIDEISSLNASLEDGYCLFNLHEQWRGAFSFFPGRREAIDPILSLAKKLKEFSSDDTLQMYASPEWKKLVLLRGPVESVMLRRCKNCKHSYVCMGTSGFYDANGLVCDSCGNVYFKSYYDETDTPKCACGAIFPTITSNGCQKCGEHGYLSEGEMSPYEYFSTHSYHRGSGA